MSDPVVFCRPVQQLDTDSSAPTGKINHSQYNASRWRRKILRVVDAGEPLDSPASALFYRSCVDERGTMFALWNTQIQHRKMAAMIDNLNSTHSLITAA